MTCLKNLSREYDIDPFKLRAILRKEFGYAKGRRWQWEEKDKDLKKIRAYLSKNYSSGTKPSPKIP